jgi:PKD repeat protein
MPTSLFPRLDASGSTVPGRIDRAARHQPAVAPASGANLRAALFAWGFLLLVLLAIPVRALAANVTLAWDPVSSPVLSGYTLHHGNSAGNYTTTIDAGGALSWTVSGLVEGSTYYFAVRAYDTSGVPSDYSNVVAVTVPYGAPLAAFSASTQSGTAPLALNFINASTGNITSYAWTFGDGTTSTAQNPTKTYTSAGSYTVGLQVSGPGGTNTKTLANYITVTAGTDTTAPTAPAGLAASAGATSVNLTWSASTDNVGVTGYRVERCQGAGCSSFVQIGTSAGTSYSDAAVVAGTAYSYRVRAADAAGNLSAYSGVAAATASIAAPVAAFVASATTGAAPLTVTFSSSSTGSITSYAWTFGDGTMSTAQSPSKTYSVAGSYTVSLTVSGAGGSNTLTRSSYITVTSTTPPPTGGTGALAGSVIASSSAVDLSVNGRSDWIKWPENVRKSTVATQISSYAVVGGASAGNYSGDRRSLAWTDGSPTVTGSSTNGVAISGIGTGFSMTAPADTTSRTLTIYAGAEGVSGTLTARLSDGSAPNFVSTTTVTKWGKYNLVYTLTYKAASAGQTLNVTWIQTATGGSKWRSSTPRRITLQGAALSTSTSP